MTDDHAPQAGPIPRPVLAQVARGLFGRDWVTELADALGVERRTVTRWKHGDTRITPRIGPELQRLIADRIAELHRASAALARVLEARAGAGADEGQDEGQDEEV